MALDPELVSAVEEVCKELEQPDKVAKRLVAWLKESSEKQLSAAQDGEHLDMLRKAIEIVTDDDL
jgi:hexokinase